MGIFYTAGETKNRPGVYQRYSNVGGQELAGALNGICAISLSASWGPIGIVTEHESSASLKQTYGYCEGIKVAQALFKGGAKKVYVIRVEGDNENGGSFGTANLVNESSTSLVAISSKYKGNRTLKVQIANDISNNNLKHIYVLEGSTQVEKFSFLTDALDERDNLVNALANSLYIMAANSQGSSVGILVEQIVTLEGTDPVASINEYGEAFELLEPYTYNVLLTDQALPSYNNLVATYVDEVFQKGKLIMGVVGERVTNIENTNAGAVSFSTRCTNANAFNNEKIIYMGSGFKDSEEKVWDGALAVAYTAGVVASTPSNQSITHLVVKGAVETLETLTNANHELAISSGMITLSVNADNQLWFDSGVTTLVTPNNNQDNGWKKIRRVKTRLEALDRIDRSIAPKIGKINNDADGIAEIIQTGMGVLSKMNSERKIKTGFSMYEDPDNQASDSAWFIVALDDIDSLEKIYLHYQFRYNETA